MRAPVRGIITAALVASVIAYLFGNAAALSRLMALDPGRLLLLAGLVFLSYVVGSLNLYLVLRAKHADLRWAPWFRYHLMKRFMNMHLPQSGNVYEALKLKERFGVGLYHYAESFAAVNWFAATFNVLMALLALITALVIHRDPAIVPAIGIVAALLALLVAAPYALDTLLARLDRDRERTGIERLRAKAHQLVVGMRSDILGKGLMPRLMLNALTLFVVSVVALDVGFGTIGQPVAWLELIPFAVLNIFMGLVNLLPGNVGVNEYAYGLLGTAYDMELASGIILSLVYRIASYLAFVLAALLFAVLPTPTLPSPPSAP